LPAWEFMGLGRLAFCKVKRTAPLQPSRRTAERCPEAVIHHALRPGLPASGVHWHPACLFLSPVCFKKKLISRCGEPSAVLFLPGILGIVLLVG